MNSTNKIVMDSKSKIKGPIFIGRSFAEYINMFDLDLNKLKNKNILDCAAGASSFTADMTQKGFSVKAVDIIYDKDAEFLQNKCKEHLNILVDAIDEIKDHFEWNYFKNLDELKKHRTRACDEFYADYKNYKGKKYIKGDLTRLPFTDNSFSLVLCSHLLFIYDHRLSYKFHLNSIKEMIRVADEVRIYPLVKHKKEKSPFVFRIMDELKEIADFKFIKVDYEFRKGGNEMMKINKK